MMIASRNTIARSNGRCPRDCRPSSTKAITPVITPPVNSGIPNSRCRATAPPITSARSVAIATSSAWAHMNRFRHGVRCSRHSSGRFFPVASPSLAESDWMSIAIRLATTITHTSR